MERRKGESRHPYSRRLPIVPLAVVLVALSLLAACESVFTTSPLAFLQRDPSKLSPEQQVAYGHDALASGDPAKMAAAYEALKDSDDPNTQLLAADLALGAVELEATLLAAAGADDPVAAIDDALEGFTDDEIAMMANAAALVDAADDTVAPTAEQYFFAAAALITVAADANGGTTGLDGLTPADPGYDEVQQAQAFLDAAQAALTANGESTDLLEGVGDAIGWTP